MNVSTLPYLNIYIYIYIYIYIPPRHSPNTLPPTHTPITNAPNTRDGRLVRLRLGDNETHNDYLDASHVLSQLVQEGIDFDRFTPYGNTPKNPIKETIFCKRAL